MRWSGGGRGGEGVVCMRRGRGEEEAGEGIEGHKEEREGGAGRKEGEGMNEGDSGSGGDAVA